MVVRKNALVQVLVKLLDDSSDLLHETMSGSQKRFERRIPTVRALLQLSIVASHTAEVETQTPQLSRYVGTEDPIL